MQVNNTERLESLRKKLSWYVFNGYRSSHPRGREYCERWNQDIKRKINELHMEIKAIEEGRL